ncbi:MAG: hypothetical protein DMF13_09830 [Verrucomicrobia bacterium]|nr:MAG: hypothetical protein DMF13_09830 [Verrucomicrobiota bacterium]
MDEQSQIVAAEAAVSAALEPPRRRFLSRQRKARPPPLPYCENCGAPMAGPFCAQCGQAAVDYRRSFRHIIVDVLDSFLSWDSKFFATIGWLIARPWHLTNQFLAGRRVRYVHPLRLYLLVSILFFFVVNYWAKSIHADPSKLSAEDRADIAAELNDPDIPPAAKARIRRALDAKGGTQPEAQTSPSPQTAVTPQPSVIGSPVPSVTTSPSPSGDFGPLVQFDKPASTGFEKWLEQRAKEKMGEHGSKMALFIATLFSNLPYMMLCCIPLFAFVLKVLYVRKRIFYIDHLVYALHIHSFAYLAIMLIVLITLGLNRSIPGTFAGWIIAALWITFATQIFLSIRRVYRQGWFFTFFKFFLGGFAYLIVLTVALATTFFITIALP